MASRRRRRRSRATPPPTKLAPALALYRKAADIARQVILELLEEEGELQVDALPDKEDVRARFAALFGTRAISRTVRVVASDLTSDVDQSITRVLPSATVGGGEATIAAFRRRNVRLIRRIGDNTLERVTEVLTEREFEHPSALKAALEEQFDISKSQAELWARDQTLKLAGDIQQERQEGAGITQYIWRTAGDARVREDHAELEGTTQSWANPPVVDDRTGRRAHPGRDFQCRCVAEPVLPE